MSLRFVVAMTGMDPDHFMSMGPVDSNDPEAVDLLNRWYDAHLEMCYPVEMFDLDREEGLAELRQWFADQEEVAS